MALTTAATHLVMHHTTMNANGCNNAIVCGFFVLDTCVFHFSFFLIYLSPFLRPG